MGIKNFSTIIKRYAPDCKINREINYYTGKKFVIDTSIYLYKFRYNDGNHISGFIRQIDKLLRNNITPIYILDGKPPKEKSYVLHERRKHKDSLKAKLYILNALKYNDILDNVSVENQIMLKEYEQLDNTQLQAEINKNSKRLINITDEHTNDCIKLFELMGVPYIVANGEAEILCAILTKYGYADACLSDDTDILPNGGTIYLRGLKNNILTEYSLERLLDNLQMTFDMFIDMCILCGCDYTNTIKGVGPINAYHLIHKYKTIENIIEYEVPHNNKYYLNNFNYQKARDIFKNNEESYDNIEQYSNLKCQMLHPELTEFIKSKSKLNNNYIKNLIKLLKRNLIQE
jgi:flap endonuclease-1